ncbi:MAG: acetylglutamate kinase [Phycisphaerales bacterium]
MDSIRDILTNLLHNLASRAEIDRYLRDFTGVDSLKFAVIKVGGGILRDARDDLAAALSFLQRVGLFPIVVHGGGPQLDRALKEASIESQTLDGLRVTTPDVLRIVRRVLHEENVALVDALEERSTRARPITSGVFEASLIDADRLGFVGKVERVHIEPIEAAIRSRHLPIVACLGETADGQIVNVNGDVAARALAKAVQPYKIIFLTPTGGLLDEHGSIIPAVNLAEDYERLIAEPWVQGGMALKLREIKQLLDDMPASTSVSITRPDHLARELFTHRGSGTLIRSGEPIHHFDSFDQIDQQRMRDLVERSFGRPLRANYFETRQPRAIFVTHSYSAAAIITTEADMAYLDKFAVSQEAQGAGHGASVWSRVREAVPRMFWRARPDNPINDWYFRKSEGTMRAGEWIVFWYGLDSLTQAQQCVEHAASLAPSIEPVPEVVHAA